MTDNACDYIGHAWEAVGSHWLPTYMAYTYPMPEQRDAEVCYIDYKCRRCGQTIAEEKLHSKRKITPESKP